MLDVTDARLDVTQLKVTDVKAWLTDDQGDPIAGQRVYFQSSSGRELGTAVTDESGVADLGSVPIELGPGIVDELLQGYDASFAGDATHSGADAHGQIQLAV